MLVALPNGRVSEESFMAILPLAKTLARNIHQTNEARQTHPGALLCVLIQNEAESDSQLDHETDSHWNRTDDNGIYKHRQGLSGFVAETQIRGV